ncbi:tRNA (adenosine(37)-N6)-threonylcarbamoyltransferase complex ATPase subunit type 1 TsaE [Algibacter aquimarinus]|uniref:tRNA threonylcarbamoyladenosine biosynthesis protein TsaE n=1 Tax=Algibacter aquimarinus TaxID=1136748 RepID=A0ABP9HFC9_9FLAO
MEITYELNDVNSIANQVINNLTSKTIFLYGDMGVGKTTLIKAIVKALGSDDEVSSPTFSIVNQYELGDDKIYHFDLYRVKSLDEAYNFGIEDYLYSNNWIIIEWPELIEDILSDNIDSIYLKIESENCRKLLIKQHINQQ